MGAAAFLYRVGELRPERRDRLSLGVAYATRGPRFVEARWYDYLLFGTRAHTAWDVRLGDDNQAPYRGEGAQLGGLPVAPGSGTPPPEFRYHDRRAFASALLAAPIARALEGYGRLPASTVPHMRRPLDCGSSRAAPLPRSRCGQC